MLVDGKSELVSELFAPIGPLTARLWRCLQGLHGNLTSAHEQQSNAQAQSFLSPPHGMVGCRPNPASASACGSGHLSAGPATCVRCACQHMTEIIRAFQVGKAMDAPLLRSSSRNEGSSLSGYGTAFDVGGSPQISTATARSRGVCFHPARVLKH